MQLSKGQMAITILDDGTIKTETSDMAGASHKAADDFLKMVAQLAGGSVTETPLKKGHVHSHGQGHTRSHEHGEDHHHH